MIRARLRLCLAILALAVPALAASGKKTVTVFMVGDSTMADKPLEGNPERGWGQMLPLYLDDSIAIANHAVNGRSTKSFIDEGRWGAVLRSLSPGDFVTIQFAHNDEKKEDPRRYTEPHTTYKENLERFVREARAAGATPILCTPVMRRRFDGDGRFFDTHGEYPDVVRQVARDQDVALIDMARSSERLIVQHGALGSKRIFLWIEPGRYVGCPQGRQDDTHFSEYGAM